MKPKRVKKLNPEAPLRPNAARLIQTRLDEMRSFAEAALDPGAEEVQHNMRIAAKRLRYLLDITGRCFGPEAEAARLAARKIQTVLGDIHDCDVMMPRVGTRIEQLTASDARALLLQAAGEEKLEAALVRNAPNRDAYRGLDLLRVHLRARRALLFERFRSLWQAEVSKGTWAALERSLD
jgi:hypothetical protein